MNKWKTLEDAVRQYAEYIWERPARADRLAGTNFDCIIRVSEIESIVIEITQNNCLNKIRDDSAKINSIRYKMAGEGIVLRSFIVCDFQPTQGMIDTGKENHVEVLSFKEFQRKFFDFDSYKNIRLRKQFGSAIDPVTGKKDDSSYTPVTYTLAGSEIEISISDIAARLIRGEKIILLGDYGTGKSRCFKELFSKLDESTNKTYYYPIAIDLKDMWGLENSIEIIRRHFSNLGISENNTNNIIKAFNSESLCFLLDGFDEIGSRPWNEDKKKLEELRRFALQGVKDLLSKTGAGFIISGRDHYFNSNDEMFSTLGIKESEATIIRCKEEFDLEEFQQFLDINNINIKLPKWIPKKPLILKTIASMPQEELSTLFSNGNGEAGTGIWFKFIDYMCERDASIHAVLDGGTVKEVLKALARKTRNKPQNIGPITENEIVEAFKDATNTHPSEQATVMLQRLPGLGRVSTETGDRNFIDDFILDGLRALDVSSGVHKSDKNLLNHSWVQPLKKLGVEILAHDIDNSNTHSAFIETTKKAIRTDKSNKIVVSDIISALNKTRVDFVDYEGLLFTEPHFGVLDFSYNKIKNLEFSHGIFEELNLGKIDPSGVIIFDSLIENLSGIPSEKGMPAWIKDSKVSEFRAVDTLTAIKSSGLTDAQTILVSILIKVYRQAGNGRLEHTLVKGLTQVNKGLLKDILHYLIRNKFLETSKDKGETIYKPVRKNQGKIDKILTELDRSKDDIWLHVSSLGIK
jgi:hypothetical protein